MMNWTNSYSNWTIFSIRVLFEWKCFLIKWGQWYCDAKTTKREQVHTSWSWKSHWTNAAKQEMEGKGTLRLWGMQLSACLLQAEKQCTTGFSAARTCFPFVLFLFNCPLVMGVEVLETLIRDAKTFLCHVFPFFFFACKLSFCSCYKLCISAALYLVLSAAEQMCWNLIIPFDRRNGNYFFLFC